MPPAIEREPLERFRDEARAIRDGAHLQIFNLLCAAASSVTLLFAAAALIKAPGTPYAIAMVASFVAFTGCALWTHTTRRIDTGLTLLATLMVLGIGVMVALQRGSHAPALAYGLTTVAVVFIAGRTRLGVVLGLGLAGWTLMLNWAAASGRFGLDLPNPLGTDNARLLAFVIALVLIGWATVIDQRWRRRLDVLLDRAINLTEAERDEAWRLAERRARAVSEIGHEIRTPMTGIVGATQLLAQQPMNPVQRQLLSIQRDSAERLLQLVSAVLDEARLASSSVQAAQQPYSLRTLCAEVTELFAAKAHRKGLEIIWTAERGLPRAVLGDAMRMRQVLSNLVSNAVKFTEHGAVQVHAALAANEKLRVDVIDSGPGLAPERRETVFDRFVSETAAAESRHSSGLGLPICRELAQLMGGSVTVAPVPAGGCCFTLELPCVPALPLHGEDLAGAPPIGGCVWVVGASVALQLQLRFLLEELGSDARFVDHLPSDGEWQAAAPQPQALLIDIWQGHGRCADELPQALAQAGLGTRRVIVINSVAQDAALGVLDSVWQLFRPPRLNSLREALSWAYEERPQTVPAAPRNGPRQSVLLVDDNAVNQIVGRAMLELLGADVVVADSGASALQAYAQRSFDLVLMDLQMPGLDGLQATRQLRQAEQAASRARTPVIAVTGLAEADVRADCIQAGIDGVLTKPYTAEQLAAFLTATTGSAAQAVAQERGAGPG